MKGTICLLRTLLKREEKWFSFVSGGKLYYNIINKIRRNSSIFFFISALAGFFSIQANPTKDKAIWGLFLFSRALVFISFYFSHKYIIFRLFASLNSYNFYKLFIKMLNYLFLGHNLPPFNKPQQNQKNSLRLHAFIRSGQHGHWLRLCH